MVYGKQHRTNARTLFHIQNETAKRLGRNYACEVIDIKPQEHIAYTYRGEATGEKALACAGIHSDTADKLTKGIFTKLDTVLSFTLEPTCGGTILHLEHSGYKGLKLAIISLIMQMGWKKQLTKKLPKVLEQMTT